MEYTRNSRSIRAEDLEIFNCTGTKNHIEVQIISLYYFQKNLSVQSHCFIYYSLSGLYSTQESLQHPLRGPREALILLIAERMFFAIEPFQKTLKKLKLCFLPGRCERTDLLGYSLRGTKKPYFTYGKIGGFCNRNLQQETLKSTSWVPCDLWPHPQLRASCSTKIGRLMTLLLAMVWSRCI